MGCFKPQPSHGTKVTVDMRESVGLPAASKKGRRRDLEKKSWGLPKGRAAPGKCLSRAGPGFQLEVTGWISQSHGRKSASRSVADDALLPPFFFHTRGEGIIGGKEQLSCARARTDARLVPYLAGSWAWSLLVCCARGHLGCGRPHPRGLGGGS